MLIFFLVRDGLYDSTDVLWRYATLFEAITGRIIFLSRSPSWGLSGNSTDVTDVIFKINGHSFQILREISRREKCLNWVITLNSCVKSTFYFLVNRILICQKEPKYLKVYAYVWEIKFMMKWDWDVKTIDETKF